MLSLKSGSAAASHNAFLCPTDAVNLDSYQGTSYYQHSSAR